jgi:hypothetical protein
MTRATALRLAFLSILSLVPSAASASLGGMAATVEADRVRMNGALVGIQLRGSYTVHSVQSPTGITIRQYYTSNGRVFGIAWEGPWQPDLRQLFGEYFDRYRSGVQRARTTRAARGRVAIDDGAFVVRIGGHLHAIAGVAYIPQLFPIGVDAAVVR